MQQQLIEWSKTILLSQSIMPRILSAIQKENDKMLSLGYGSRHFEKGMSTYDFLDRLLLLNIRRKNLEELSQVVTEILEGMEDGERRMLEERFFEKKSVQDTMPKTNIRTIYRRYNSALEHFARALVDYGYDLDTIERILGSDRIISSIHSRVLVHGVIFRKEMCATTKPVLETMDINIKVDLPQHVEVTDNRLRA